MHATAAFTIHTNSGDAAHILDVVVVVDNAGTPAPESFNFNEQVIKEVTSRLPKCY